MFSAQAVAARDWDWSRERRPTWVLDIDPTLMPTPGEVLPRLTQDEVPSPPHRQRAPERAPASDLGIEL